MDFNLLDKHTETETPKESKPYCRGYVSTIAILVLLGIIVALIIVLATGTNKQCDSCNCNCVRSYDVICGMACGRVCLGKATDTCFAPCFDACQKPSPSVGLLSSYLTKDAIQHVGITVSNLTRSVDFYTRFLGGVEVPGAGGEGWDGDDSYQLLMQHEILNNMSDIAQLQSAGCDTLSARYISFGALQIELLYYHARNAACQTQMPVFHKTTAPSVAQNMHVAFHVADNVNLNDFINRLESEASKAGYAQVKCNRLKPVANEEERQKMGLEHPEYNSMRTASGDFMGWGIAYCKGVDGEQIEFNQVFQNAKVDFDKALGWYLSGQEGPIW
eukprot:TRINITY_DN1511_c0_g1_i1.p1 TRINITY_DN1511_c0_g1~~TRINITY_DN1511_c0_g1_i1.p1  ORF type:complete len:331 (+),score=62.58 TRINITY_DN1511_c0_g1_i1:200-1192(+)